MNFLDLLFPRRCVGCGRIGNYFCKQCRLKIESITYPICPVCGSPAIDGATHPRCQTKYTIDGLTSFFRYDGIIRKAVKLLKYQFVSDLTKEFISLTPLSSLQPITHNSSPITLIPIPLHPSRLRFRGFNQAEVLGKLIANKSKIPMRTDILKRIKKTTPQVEMKDRKKRLANMEGVFSVNQSALRQSSGQAVSNYQSTIFLFDDVFTTGATMCVAANVLKRAGMGKVWGVVMAHG